MTPKCKTANSTTLIIERQELEPPSENGDEKNVHIAGGDHKGIVINKQAANGSLIFRFLKSTQLLVKSIYSCGL